MLAVLAEVCEHGVQGGVYMWMPCEGDLGCDRDEGPKGEFCRWSEYANEDVW